MFVFKFLTNLNNFTRIISMNSEPWKLLWESNNKLVILFQTGQVFVNSLRDSHLKMFKKHTRLLLQLSNKLSCNFKASKHDPLNNIIIIFALFIRNESVTLLFCLTINCFNQFFAQWYEMKLIQKIRYIISHNCFQNFDQSIYCSKIFHELKWN